MEKNTEMAMMANLKKNTNKELTEWVTIANQFANKKHVELVNHLMKEHSLGRFFADLIVHKARGTDSGSMDHHALIMQQFKGKEQLRNYYDVLISKVTDFGDDVEISPKKAYVSLRRKKQFACLKPATISRFEIDLILKDQETRGILETITGAGAMCTHRIKLKGDQVITKEIEKWLKLAYDQAGNR